MAQAQIKSYTMYVHSYNTLTDKKAFVGNGHLLIQCCFLSLLTGDIEHFL